MMAYQVKATSMPVKHIESPSGVPAQKIEIVEAIQQKPLPEALEKRLEPIVVADTPKAVISIPSGTHIDWMNQAGIPASDHDAVNCIIAGCNGVAGESGWRVAVVNSSGCIGLVQACNPGLKVAMLAECPNWQTDPICQLKVGYRYMLAYGSATAAWNFRKCVGSCFSTRINKMTYKDHTWF